MIDYWKRHPRQALVVVFLMLPVLVVWGVCSGIRESVSDWWNELQYVATWDGRG